MNLGFRSPVPIAPDEERARRAYLNARCLLAGLTPDARARVLDGVK